ncbi:receptor-interacting serine/threonine-protein kinase 1 [Astyanax mexicanus]|uniref:receptor-interacting serine/threonine-protein kinase 1 n=1 Tax=Astyanax mexicanus TaxID=7994 RepID=UPI0020CB2215|nr:receptor-interacting serine/threonine-protein kinase 1 [Astyanax mexicanus]XP_049338017.1 receptor-interacting serine/threonine-protein kinase 1 [Astyanax mexicanus]XP_049338018.1 receptor-interacting serine/threonine-protein kinase 1 [Astyanax mexicanus]
MATGSSLDIYMKSSDLIRKKRLDYGGFGEVYLCYHKTLGQVVQKTVYTGPPRNEQKPSLLEEGSLMSRLNHERVVKLLGVILEDGDYSLVMELIPRGNLLAMLERVSVPISIKGRIILEILEGMVYLTNNQVIHKDLKPENILVDEHFHVKIADLGLATHQTWSKLTRDESRRQSRLGVNRKSSVRAAGTLCYMAPEHLESVHTRSSEKSDVYSFAIVVWVVLTSQEPYENARSEDQICQCVRQGDRPDEQLIPDDAPPEITRLMKACWDQDPQKRPTFKESYNSFLPVYREKLETDVEKDLHGLMDLYEGPSDLVEKMKALSTELPPANAGLEPPSYPQSTRDSPTPLRSSDLGPVEASIEDLSLFSAESLQVDAAPCSPPNLDQKLAQEFNYHKWGSYTRTEPPDLSPYSYSTQSSQAVANHRQAGDLPQQVSSVQSWTKPSPQPSAPEEAWMQPSVPGPFEGQHRPHYENQMSGPYPHHYDPYQRQHPQFNRLQSWPGVAPHPMSESTPKESCAGLRVSSPVICPQPETGPSLYITQASGIQIGNNNTMNFRNPESSLNSMASSSPVNKCKELLQKYEDHTVTKDQLDLVQENVGLKWKACARRLDLTQMEIDEIEHDYDRDGLSEKVHQMLERWKMKEGFSGCTVGKLCRALEKCGKGDVILKLLLKSQDNTVL